MNQPQMPFDLQTQQAGIDQRKALLQALMQQNMQMPQGQMVSGHYVAPNPLTYLTPLIAAYTGSKGLEGLRKEGAQLSQQYNTRLSEGLKQYLGNTQPGQTLSEGQAADLLQNDVDPGKLAEPSRDPHAAAATAIASGLPELRQIGLEDMKALAAGLRKNSEPEEFGTEPRMMMDPATKQLVNVLVGKRGTIRPVPGLAPATKLEATSGGHLYDPYKGTSGPFVGEKYTDPRNVNGEMVSFGLDSNKPVQAANRPPQTSINNAPVIAAQKAGMSEWSKLAAQTVSDLAADARGSVKLLGTLNQLEASGQAGIFTGPTANAATFLTGLGQVLGVPIDANKLANSQTFDAASISAWQDMIKAAGGNRGVVKEEAQRLAQMVPQLSQSPQGRKQLTEYLRQMAKQTVDDAQQAQKEYATALREDNPGAFTFGLGTAQIPRDAPLPPAAGAASPSGAPGTIHWNDLPTRR